MRWGARAVAALLCLLPATPAGSGQPDAGPPVVCSRRPAAGAGAGAGAVQRTLALRGGLDASRRDAQEAALRRAEEALAAQPGRTRDDASEGVDDAGADCSGGEPAGASGTSAPPALLPRGVTWCELCGPRVPRAGPTRPHTSAMR